MAKRILLLGVIVAGGFFYLGQGSVVYADAADHLVISEVQVGGGATDDEFIELYNPTSTAVDISTWSLQYKSATGATFQKKNFESEASVPAHGFFLIARSAYDGTVLADMAQGTFLLAASGGNIFLVSNQTSLTSSTDSAIIDKVAYGTGNSPEDTAAPAPLANQSIERRPGGTEGNGTDTNNNANDFFLQTNPNPQNSSSPAIPPIVGGEGDNPSPPPLNLRGGEVVINEFVPNPTNSIEWIELYNKTANGFDLEGIKISDGTGNVIKTLSGSILAQGFFVAELVGSKLNNSGDLIKLQTADNTIIDMVVYGNWDDGNLTDNAPAPIRAGQSIARKSNGLDTNNDKEDFVISDTPSQGLVNVITTIEVVGGNVPLVYDIDRKVELKINEFVSDPEDGPEWVELYNSGQLSVDLGGWWLEDGSETKTELSGTSVPEWFLVFENIKGNLDNKGDIIRLKNEKGEVVDSVSYGVWEDGKPSDNAQVAKDPLAVARKKDGVDTNNDKNDFAVTSTVTKGKKNIIEEIKIKNENEIEDENNMEVEIEVVPRDQVTTNSDLVTGTVPPPTTIGRIFIFEIMPNPEGADSQDEWVELYNNGDEAINLNGFKIDDAEGGSKAHTLSDLTIAPKGYLVLPRPLTKIALNNDTDEARLFDTNDNLIDAIEYEEGKQGQSYASGSDGLWSWTTKATPGQTNIIEISGVTEAVKGAKVSEVVGTTLDKVRELEINTGVRVKGVVSVLPGVLGSQIFYITGIEKSGQATVGRGLATNGLQVYSYKKDFPALDMGDLTQVTGTLAQAQGEFRIKTKTTDDIKVLAKGDAPAPYEFVDGELDENVEGSLIKLQGTIIDATRSKLVVDTGFAEVPIVIKKTTGIEMGEIIPGLQVSITGIVGNSTSGYVVLPRFQQDIQVIGKDELLAQNSETDGASSGSLPYAKATAYTFGGAALAALGIRRRRMFTNGFRAALFMINRRNKKGIL